MQANKNKARASQKPHTSIAATAASAHVAATFTMVDIPKIKFVLPNSFRQNKYTGCPKKKYLSEITGSEMQMENLDRFEPCQIILDHTLPYSCVLWRTL